jgi:hypothetical protein
MEKVKVTEVGEKFKDLPRETPSTLRYNPKTRNMILEVKGYDPVLICCDHCGGDKFVPEGALVRCIYCNHLFLIGFM